MDILSILLVDDDRNLVTTLSHGLRKAMGEAISVAVCFNGTEALSMLAAQAFDVVISDHNMPGPSGLELLSRVRQDYRETTLVLMTAYGTDVLEEGVSQLGGGYMTKPFEPSSLAQLIKGLIHGEETKGRTEKASRIMDKLGKPAGSSLSIRLEGLTNYMNNDATSSKDYPGQPVTALSHRSNGQHLAKIFVVCNQRDTAPVWGYILREQGLTVILETSLEKAIDRWSMEIPDLVVLDLSLEHKERLELYQRFRAVSVAPILLFLPTYHEIEILDAYQAGVDDVIIKPVSPPIFLAKIMAWVRRSWTVPVEDLSHIKAGSCRLDPAHRCLIEADGMEVRLTNLEFQLMHLLMSRPGRVFEAEDIVQAIWGGFGKGDQVLLKNVVYRLRRKIEENPGQPMLLRTEPGGYSFYG